MQTQDAYDQWAKTYDTVINKTRDLEATAIRSVLGGFTFDRIIEIGCGTGKNTGWLAERAGQLTAVDFSAEMLEAAKTKALPANIRFRQADITEIWPFEKANLVTCSLVLEHIRDISFIFSQAASVLDQNGLFFICELHPYKQLQGSRAKFEQDGAVTSLEYFIHHLSEFFETAKQHGFTCDQLEEWFDGGDKTTVPRLASFLFRKA